MESQEYLSPNLHAGKQGTSIGQGKNSDVSFLSTLVEADLEITTIESCGYEHPGIVILILQIIQESYILKVYFTDSFEKLDVRIVR